MTRYAFSVPDDTDAVPLAWCGFPVDVVRNPDRRTTTVALRGTDRRVELTDLELDALRSSGRYDLRAFERAVVKLSEKFDAEPVGAVASTGRRAIALTGDLS